MMFLTVFRSVEEDPWRAIASMIHTVQISCLTLDLAINPGVDLSWHHVVTSVELICAVLLALYQTVRIRDVVAAPWPSPPCALSCSVVASPSCPDEDQPTLERLQRWTLRGLSVSLCLQVVLAALAAASVVEECRAIEWAAFVLAILWAVMTHGATGAQVRTYWTRICGRDPPAPKPSLTFGGVLRSIAGGCVRPPRERPVLVGIAVLAALHAAMIAFQGVAMLWLMQAGTAYYGASRAASASESSLAEVQDDGRPCRWTGCPEKSLAFSALGLLAEWFTAQAAGVLLDGLGAAAILRWEVWVRDRIVVRATDSTTRSHHWGREGRAVSQVYEADVGSAMELQFAALGFVVQILVGVASWGVLAALDWGVAAICLSLLSPLAMASGSILTSPVDLLSPSPSSHALSVREAAVRLQWSLPVDGSGAADIPATCAVSGVSLIELHCHDLLEPMRESLLHRLIYSDSAVDAFVNWYASMVTAAVVVRLAFDMAEGRNDTAAALAALWVHGKVIGAAVSVPDLVRRVAGLAHSWRSIEAIAGGGDAPTAARALAHSCLVVREAAATISSLEEGKYDNENEEKDKEEDDDASSSSDGDGTCSV